MQRYTSIIDTSCLYLDRPVFEHSLTTVVGITTETEKMLRTLTRALRRDFHYSITPFAITKVGVSSMGGSIIEGKLMQEMKITDAKHKDKVIASLETDKVCCLLFYMQKDGMLVN